MTRSTSQNTNKRSTRRSARQQTSPSTGRARDAARLQRPAREQAPSRHDARDGARFQATSQARRPSAKTARQARPSGASQNEQRGASPARASAKRSERKRQRTKEKAERMFNRQMVQRDKHDAAPQEGAPRAAVYKGEMGATHRKSARMQRASEAGPVSAKINPAGWFSNLSLKPRTLKIATAALCVVLVGLFLYTPAKHYYQAQREHDRLVAEYAVVEQRNDTLDGQNDALASDAGMEDAVRQKYGYVTSGEETAVVTGLSESTIKSQHGVAEVEGNVLSSAVKAPEQWYTPMLDAFFGVE